MGRPHRIAAGGVVYHVTNRGNGGRRVFRKDADYAAFVAILAEGLAAVPARLLAYCLMPNHWHLVVWPRRDGDLSRLVGWVTNTHVKRYKAHSHDAAGGHLYQARFRSFPVEADGHLLTVLRYVEANPLRARLASRAGDWPWSSYAARAGGDPDGLLAEWPVPRPADWGGLVEARWAEDDLSAVRTCARRGRPFGSAPWTRRAARRLGLESTLRPVGRPRTTPAPAR